MKTVYMFPGQGSQHPGMGENLFDQFPEHTAQASNQLGYCIKTLCLEDPKQELNQTQFTQPALYVVNALTLFAREETQETAPDIVLGHSLGEYNALLAAKAFDFITGLKLVQKRGELMSQVQGGGMAAVLGLALEDVANILESEGLESIDLANINSHKQIVISGPADDIPIAVDIFKNAGAKRVVPLTVSGAFHSRYMKEPQQEYATFVKQFSFNTPICPIISNYQARPYEHDEIGHGLIEQLTHSVQWVKSIEYIRALGEADYIEVGPGKVLAGLLRQI